MCPVNYYYYYYYYYTDLVGNIFIYRLIILKLIMKGKCVCLSIGLFVSRRVLMELFQKTVESIFSNREKIGSDEELCFLEEVTC
jgi:hypothetical protein